VHNGTVTDYAVRYADDRCEVLSARVASPHQWLRAHNHSQEIEMGKRMGFAAMDPALQRVIASKGGKAAHQKGTAHKWTIEEARNAGRKGGIASHPPARIGPVPVETSPEGL
jgi:general stress protein YciG